jgi:hypothetical protein
MIYKKFRFLGAFLAKIWMLTAMRLLACFTTTVYPYENRAVSEMITEFSWSLIVKMHRVSAIGIVITLGQKSE